MARPLRKNRIKPSPPATPATCQTEAPPQDRSLPPPVAPPAARRPSASGSCVLAALKQPHSGAGMGGLRRSRRPRAKAGRGRAVPPPPLAPALPPFCTRWATYYTLVAARACGGAWAAQDDHCLYEERPVLFVVCEGLLQVVHPSLPNFV